MSRYRDLGLFAFLALAWGGMFPAVKAGLAYFPPVVFSAFRYDLAALALLGYAAVTTDRWLPRTADDFTAVAVTGVFMIAGSSLLFVGQQYTTSGVAAILYSFIPILTTVLAWFLLVDERLSPVGVSGVVVGFVGAALVIRPDPTRLLTPDIVGKGFVFGAAASIALGTVLLRRTSPTVSRPGMMGWAMILGAVLTHGVSLAIGESPTAVVWAPAAPLILAYVVVFPTAVAFLAYYDLLLRIGAVQANLVSYANPIVATVLGWILLGETIDPATVAGFAVIVVGFGLVKHRALAAELRLNRTPVE